MAYSENFNSAIKELIYNRLDGDSCMETAEGYVHDEVLCEDPALIASLRALNAAADTMVARLAEHFDRLNLDKKYNMNSSEL